MPSFRRFHSANVATDETLVKGWRIKGDSCEIGPANGPAADSLEREARGLQAEGKSGYA
jgi:hypothetical protein